MISNVSPTTSELHSRSPNVEQKDASFLGPVDIESSRLRKFSRHSPLSHLQGGVESTANWARLLSITSLGWDEEVALIAPMSLDWILHRDCTIEAKIVCSHCLLSRYTLVH